MNIGLDVDGVLANFNDPFINRIVEITGKDLFPARPFEIPTWNYPQHFGYTDQELKQVWAEIQRDRAFWQWLFPYDDAKYAMDACLRWDNAGHNIYFITNRAGVDVKHQTERWLEWNLGTVRGVMRPTVLISAHKGLAAKTLELDAYVDDKYENCLDVKTARPECITALRDQGWNREPHMNNLRINNLQEFVQIVDDLGAK